MTISIEKRRAHIEFSSKKSVKITTLYKQKELDLKGGDVIDLISLNTCRYDATKPPSSFIGIIHENEGEYGIEPWIKKRDYGGTQAEWVSIGFCTLEDNSQLFDVRIISGS